MGSDRAFLGVVDERTRRRWRPPIPGGSRRWEQRQHGKRRAGHEPTREPHVSPSSNDACLSGLARIRTAVQVGRSLPAASRGVDCAPDLGEYRKWPLRPDQRHRSGASDAVPREQTTGRPEAWRSRRSPWPPASWQPASRCPASRPRTSNASRLPTRAAAGTSPAARSAGCSASSSSCPATSRSPTWPAASARPLTVTSCRGAPTIRTSSSRPARSA